MEIMDLNWGTVNPWAIAAACTYIASHLQFRAKTFGEVSLVSGVPFASIRNTYDVMYRFREQRVQKVRFAYIFWTREDALLCSRPLPLLKVRDNGVKYTTILILARLVVGVRSSLGL